MWDKLKITKAIGLLSDFMAECWQLDKVEEAETFRATIEILEKQLKMLNSFELAEINKVLNDKLK